MIILISTIPFGASCFLVYSRAVSAMKNEAQILEQKKMDKMAGSLDNFIRSMDKLCIVMLQQNDVRQVFSTKESTVNLSGCYTNIMNDLNLFTLSYGYIRGVKVYSELNGCVVSQVAVTAAENDTTGLLECYRNAGDGLYIAAADSNGAGIKTVTFMRKMKIGAETLGAVCIEVHINRLFEELGISYNDENDRLMLTDDRGRVFISSYVSDINRETESVLKSGKENGLKIYELPSSTEKWQYVHMYSETYYSGASRRMTHMVALLICLSLIMVLLTAVYISRQTFRPLAEILEYFGNGEGEQPYDSNELGYIIRSISALADENVNLTAEMQQRIVMLNKAQLCALQNQINPHFMYNTLETIKWVVMDLENEDCKASSMIEMLADVISYSLDAERYLVSLDEEIENTKTYISILKIRYEDRFHIEWEIDPRLQNVKVLKLCMQPLIENAMVHGIAPKRAEGKIRIAVKKMKSDLCVEVEDDGVGIDAEKLGELRKSLEDGHGMEGKHVGLRNVNLRTRLAFGDEYGISVFSEKGKGTKVSLLMKMQIIPEK